MLPCLSTPLEIGVECYAGHRGEQTPRTLILANRRVGVAEVLEAWLAPDYGVLQTEGEDGNAFNLKIYGLILGGAFVWLQYVVGRGAPLRA